MSLLPRPRLSPCIVVLGALVVVAPGAGAAQEPAERPDEAATPGPAEPAAPEEPDAPAPDLPFGARGELATLLRVAEGLAADGPLEPSRFLALAQPYAPLSLEAREVGREEAARLQGVYLGAAGAAAGVDPRPLLEQIGCAACPAWRRSRLAARRDALDGLLAAILADGAPALVAQWSGGGAGDYRVDDVFLLAGEPLAAVPSERLGLVPSGRWERLESVDAALEERGIDRGVAADLLDRLRALDLAAVRRLGQGGVEVALGGLGDDRSGALLLAPGVPPPEVGDLADHGGEYVILEPLGTGVWFYETR